MVGTFDGELAECGVEDGLASDDLTLLDLGLRVADGLLLAEQHDQGGVEFGRAEGRHHNYGDDIIMVVELNYSIYAPNCNADMLELFGWQIM